MALNLSPRQRAMLKDMGVRVWLPQSPAAPPTDLQPTHTVSPLNAINLIAESAANTKAKIHFSSKDTGPTAVNRSPSSALPLTSATSPWQWGRPYPLYAEQAVQAAHPGRWLVLAEMSLEALQGDSFDPLAGEAGKLLDNMLRAAQLDRSTHTTLLPWVRLSHAATPGTADTPELSDILRSTRPDVVLLMGRLAAQAVLASDLPLAKLRAQVHHLPSEPAPVPTIVTYDASYLLRNRADKAKAWDDLCLAMACVRKA